MACLTHFKLLEEFFLTVRYFGIGHFCSIVNVQDLVHLLDIVLLETVLMRNFNFYLDYFSVSRVRVHLLILLLLVIHLLACIIYISGALI